MGSTSKNCLGGVRNDTIVQPTYCSVIFKENWLHYN